MKYVKPEYLSIRLHPDLNEKWIQDLISADPAMIGLGDLVLRDKERTQPRAGRLDLLLQDAESKRRYEVEIQLGATDEAHIIRTIEYWDIERKRYPQYEHCAVVIAEDITSRFLNVVSLFNGSIPLIAIQMRAMRVGDLLTLVFTTVMDEMSRGLVDEDEDAASVPTDRAYWEKRGSKATLALSDEIFEIAKAIDPNLELKYNKFYIGLSKDGKVFNFMVMKPRKASLKIEIKLLRTDEYDQMIEAAGLDVLEYDGRYGQYRLSIEKADLPSSREVLAKLIGLAYAERA